MPSKPILDAQKMREAEAVLMQQGASAFDLMKQVGEAAADIVWRMAAGRSVTVLCGPGNNGGDGFIIAGELARRGLHVTVIAPLGTSSDTASAARQMYSGSIEEEAVSRSGSVFVDCLFGMAQTRELGEELVQLLQSLRKCHELAIAVDCPSGIDSDNGRLLGSDVSYDLTIAIGAWKPAHYLMPAMSSMGMLRRVDIGINADNSVRLAQPPRLDPPGFESHKYKRGLLAIVGGEMPGAGLLAAQAAMRSGAGYVKLFASHSHPDAPAELVIVQAPLDEALEDERISAILVGPGLGRSEDAIHRLRQSLEKDRACVIDADGLALLSPAMLHSRDKATVVTPHEGELQGLEQMFDLPGTGAKHLRARALAEASQAVVVAKGPDTIIASPEGEIIFCPPATPWLSTAGTGDVLAGMIASRLATGIDAVTAAEQGYALHKAAARLAGPAFTAGMLADCAADAWGSLL
ncbi:NAD(P)H-hydrate dehydratase [Altererythrobacter sp. SALINAS58]|uniref:NAD(P)H-hydrate dehydratase n=1 Tax=Alteripontixanthobacter muriae TaxID=2705546 RepID=UPI0015751993|nr:NAD(P)H-hydrate dehydratase [Alteripontixanthobacter muriae]NTZ41937.1 NAD(P)H-hydrate dehydratase [Alteripontixanthobacter muriae]